jgi:hypothetical protein
MSNLSVHVVELAQRKRAQNPRETKVSEQHAKIQPEVFLSKQQRPKNKNENGEES